MARTSIQACTFHQAPSQRVDRRPQQAAGEKCGLNRIESGERARLIPVAPARQKEVAAVSIVLAVSRIVPEFAKAMLEEIGLKHDQSGVQPFDHMGPLRKDICSKVQNAETLTKNTPILEASIADWHPLCRYLALTLSTGIGKRIAINALMTRYRLADDFSIPNTADNIHLEADLRRRTISLSIRLDPPGDKKRPTAAVNWLTRQLRDGNNQNLLITCYWPRRIEPTTLNIADAIEHPEDLVPENVSELPTGLEVKRVVDLAGKFRGAKTMVECTQTAFVEFYRQVGQNLTPWRAPPPKYKSRKELEETVSDNSEEINVPGLSTPNAK